MSGSSSDTVWFRKGAVLFEIIGTEALADVPVPGPRRFLGFRDGQASASGASKAQVAAALLRGGLAQAERKMGQSVNVVVVAGAR